MRKRHRSGVRRHTWRAGIVGAHAVAAVTAVTVAQNVDTGGNHPLMAVANAEEFGARAARAAEAEPAAAGPRQWTYIKGTQAEISDYAPGITNERRTLERWVNFDGERISIGDWRRPDAVRPAHAPGRLNPARLSTDPATLLRQLEAASRAEEPPPGTACWRADRDGVVPVVREIMEHTAPPPRLQAALYRALPKIPCMVLGWTAQLSKGIVGKPGERP